MRVDPESQAATAIRNSLEKYKLKQWGFVIFRCTYNSQEKWDKFVTLAKEDAHNYFESTRTEDLYDKMAWTIIEDPETLDGASTVETSRRFREWVASEGRQEIQGTMFRDKFDSSPRYYFFIHVDEETLESVADDAKAREKSGYFATIVCEHAVSSREQEREAAVQDSENAGDEEFPVEDEDEDEEEDEVRDYKKRVKLDKLVDMYVWLLDDFMWYNIWVDEGIAQI